MKRMIKLNLTRLLMITAVLVWVEPINILKVGAYEQTIESNLVTSEVNLKEEKHLKEYLKEFFADDLTTEKIDRTEYLTKRLEDNHFTEEEIEIFLEITAENKKEEIFALVEDYLDEDPLLSKNTLISKIKENGYSQEEVDYGLESVDIDWNEQAVKASVKYINTEIEFEDKTITILSRKCLLQFLVEVKDFTLDEATYGIEEANIDWNEQAYKQAKYYLVADAYSKEALVKKLISDEFSKEEAEYGVAQTEIVWREQVIKRIENYLTHSLFQSKGDLLSFLKQAGFTEEEINYAVNSVFKDVEEEVEAEKSSIDTPLRLQPESLIIIKPTELTTNHVMISAQAGTNKKIDLANLSIKEPNLTSTENTQSVSEETDRVEKSEVFQDGEELKDARLFDSPIFVPVVMVLIIGNLYLFQKM